MLHLSKKFVALAKIQLWQLPFFLFAVSLVSKPPGRYLHRTRYSPLSQQGKFLTKQTHNPIQSLDKTHILSKLPAIYHAKVSKFLTFLEDYGSSWMDTYEFVSKNGEVIGNIIDLLNQAFVAKKKGPSPGWKKFITEIINANVPMNIFTKTSTKQDIEQELTKRENRQFTEEWETRVS